MSATASLDLHPLRRLRDSRLQLEDPGDDLRGRPVIDDRGTRLGRITSVLIDEADGRARFLRLRSGGILGVGGQTTLLPVEVIIRVSREAVAVAGDRSGAASTPAYRPRFVARPLIPPAFDPNDPPAYWPYRTTDYPYRVPHGG